MWIQKDLFADDNREEPSGQALEEASASFNPALFSAPVRKMPDGPTLERLASVGLSVLSDHMDWPFVSKVVKDLGCRTLADVVRLTERQISKLRVRPLTKRDAVRRLRNDVVDRAQVYLAQWDKYMKRCRWALEETDYASLPALFEALSGCLARIVENVYAENEGLSILYKEYFVEHCSVDELQSRHPDTTKETKRIRLKQCIGSLLCEEGWHGYRLEPGTVDKVKSCLDNHLYTSCACTRPLPHCVWIFLHVNGYDVLGKRADSMPDWDFITLVLYEDIRAARPFMYQILQKLSSMQFPVSQGKAMAVIMNEAQDVSMPYEHKRLFVSRTLQGHPWIEHLESGLRLRSAKLRRDYERYARIIYDAGKPIAVDEMKRQYRKIYRTSSKSVCLNVVKEKYDGFRCYGKTGYWEYVGDRVSADGHEETINHKIGRWLDDGTLPESFYLRDIVQLLEPCEREIYSLSTLSSYASIYAVKELGHADHFCRRGCEEKHPQYRWRKENDGEIMPQIIRMAVDLLRKVPLNTLPWLSVTKYIRRTLNAEGTMDSRKVGARLGRLRMYASPTVEEARRDARPFVLTQKDGKSFITLCPEVLEEGRVQSFQLNRRGNVRLMFGALYESARRQLAGQPNRELELVEIIRHFMASKSFKGQPDRKSFTAIRLRAAFTNALVPEMFLRVKHGNRVYIRLVKNGDGKS